MDIPIQDTVQDFESQKSTELVICNIKKVDAYCSKLQFTSGPSFFISEKYFKSIKSQNIYIGSVFRNQELEELLYSGFCYNVEQIALNYLNRAEQCHKGLALKLIKKGYQKDIVEDVLCILEAEGFLNDFRFASAWIRNRMISHAEGRSKLLSGLLNRGIKKDIALEAINDYFELVEESTILNKAYQKCLRLGYSEEKIQKKLIDNGFDYRDVKSLTQSK